MSEAKNSRLGDKKCAFFKIQNELFPSVIKFLILKWQTSYNNEFIMHSGHFKWCSQDFIIYHLDYAHWTKRKKLVNWPLFFSHSEHTRFRVRWKFSLKRLSFQNVNEEDASRWVHVPVGVHLGEDGVHWRWRGKIRDK